MPPRRKKAEPPVEPELQPMPSQPQGPVKGQVVVVRRAAPFSGPMWHPDQSKYIPDDVNGVEVVFDNWLHCQLAAKLVEIIEK